MFSATVLPSGSMCASPSPRIPIVVEDYWYGDETTAGLCDWEELDDTIVMLSEDNYGNVRTLPTEESKNRKGGWGMYYQVLFMLPLPHLS